LIALDTPLEMTTTTIQLSLPELDLVQRDRVSTPSRITAT
jgi:hypothetical protein